MVDYERQKLWKRGQLHRIDDIAAGSDELGMAVQAYSDSLSTNRESLHWQRTVKWLENFFYLAGRHYVDDILVSRLARGESNDDLSVVQDAARNIPKPTNDFLGRYVETNIALLTENRPVPRVTPKSDRDEDITAAQLSELTIEYLWEALQMPEKHRELVRLILLCGVAWMEVCYDPAQVKRMAVQKMREEKKLGVAVEGDQLRPNPISRQVPEVDERGRPIFTDSVQYGDIQANIVSPFEMHVPTTHWWHDQDYGMGWIMREQFVPIDVFKDKYRNLPKNKSGLTKRNGWHLDRLDKIKAENPTSLPLWWWERVSEMVEGPGPSIYIGSPETWENYCVVRVLDRKPNNKWPRGRTIITAGGVVIYDSPKDVGARAYDPRWPNRWHPYTRFRWEALPGSIYGRSLISKLLSKLKRVNAIDTTMIMWRRTVPIATWIAPKGAHVIEDIWSGRPGQIWQFDPRRTAGAKPEPVYPPPYPAAALEERSQQIAEMEAIAGTEEILRGQRPTGVTSAAMVDILRKQALMSRSAILQSQDESIESVGSAMLMETIRHIGDDPGMAQRLAILAREKASTLSIETFAGTNLSDNVQCRVDIGSMALVSKEAREAKVLEFLQAAPALMSIPDIGLRQAIIEELGFKKALTPQGPHIDRAKKMISWIKQEKFEMIIPFTEDDPYVMYELLVKEKQSEAFWNLNEQQQTILLQLIDAYKRVIEAREAQMLKLQMEMAAAGMQAGGEQGGGSQG